VGGIISPFFAVCVVILRILLYIISIESETVNKTEEFRMMAGNKKAEELASKLSLEEKKEFILANAENFDPVIEMVFAFILDKLQEEMSCQDFITFCESI
jgi:hypothetical protein